MSLNNPNQGLRRDLKEAAALLKWSGVDLMQAAVRLSELGFARHVFKITKTCRGFQLTNGRCALVLRDL